MSHSHDVVARFKLPWTGYEIEKLATEVPCLSGNNYHDFGNDWWTNGKSPESFKFLTLDSLYPKDYFDVTDTGGHPIKNSAADIYNYMQIVYKGITGHEFKSLLELGTGGGEITNAFKDNQIDYFAIEGTTGGYEALIENGHPIERIAKYDLKFMPYLRRRFDICMSTEVFEHVEPFFAAKLVENCALHSDFVWFSAADRNRRPHYHHINELPIEAWDNLFSVQGFSYQMSLNRLHDRASRFYIADHVGRRLALQSGCVDV